ncbi:MAG: isoprenylcysteine carboxylmethyltransferase family protein [Acidobacteriia bacterium]|nr:isoprenylcysteine carboxylmethyltransferase family protein [Terriglobia bacterium]
MSQPSFSHRMARWRVPLGFLAAIVYFVLARPAVQSIGIGAAVALVGVGWRAWASGMIRKDAALARDGPYGLSRNPLYFGSFLIAVGFAWAGHRAALFVGIVLFFLAIYWPVMRREEEHLEALFGDTFTAYAREVPLFLPWKGSSRRGKEKVPFTWRQYWRNREYNVLLGFCSAVALLFFIKYLRGS